MVFDPFVRDIFYLTAVLIGIVLSLFSFILFPLDRLKSRKALLIPALFCTLSAAVILAAVILVQPRWSFILETRFLAAAGILMLLTVLLSRLPRIMLVFFIAAGVFIVWWSCVFLVYPRLSGNGIVLGIINNGGDEACVLNLVSRIQTSDRKTAETLTVSEGDFPLRIDGAFIVIDEVYPFLGGDRRGIVAAVRHDGGLLYEVPEKLRRGFLYPDVSGAAESRPVFPGITAEYDTLEIAWDTVLPGNRYTIESDGSRLRLGR